MPVDPTECGHFDIVVGAPWVVLLATNERIFCARRKNRDRRWECQIFLPSLSQQPSLLVRSVVEGVDVLAVVVGSDFAAG